MSTYFRIIRSPSIRVNGVDIEPGRQDDPPFFGCRTYNVQGKMIRVPLEEWTSEAAAGKRRMEKSCEPLFSHSGPKYEKRDSGGKPKSL